MATKPQLVFVHGAWHTPSCMETLTSRLESHGYTIHTRQLPAVGAPSPPPPLSADIAAVRDLVLSAIGTTGNDVVVIAHSWGGIVAQSALVGLSKTERETNGEKGGVIRAGYMAAFIGPADMSLFTSIPFVPSWWDIHESKGHVYATDPQIFYSDLPASEQQKWFSQLQSQSLASFYDKATGASWKVIPTSYLLCELDQGIPAHAQEGMVKDVQEAGGEVQVSRVRAGHCPFLSKLGETVGWVRGVAGEVVEVKEMEL